MVHHHKSRTRSIGYREIFLLTLCGLVGVVSMFVSTSVRAPMASSETRFVETSASGLQIVPASCPSSPHNVGDCSTTGTGTAYQSGGCTITASPSTIVNGNASTLSWYVYDMRDASGTWIMRNISISSVGTVARSGSRTVNPTVSTTYTLSGSYLRSVSIPFSCSVTVSVITCPAGQIAQGNTCVSQTPPPPTSCPTGQVLQGGVCVDICPSGQHAVGSLCVCDGTNLPADNNGQCTTQSQVCPSGFQFDPGSGQCVAIQQCTLPNTCSDSTHVLNQCSGAVTNCVAQFGAGWNCQAGSCRPPAPPLASISAVPSLVAPNTTSNIAWTSSNAASCTVTGSNGDGPWTGTSGSHASSGITQQTIYTLACVGFDNSNITKSTTINIIPNWVEQ